MEASERPEAADPSDNASLAPCAEESDQKASTSEAEQRKLFKEAVARVKNWIGPAMKTSEQLALYGLYKQVSSGDCRSQQPGLLDPTGRAKWSSWKACEGLNPSEAMCRYREVVNAVCSARDHSSTARSMRISATDHVTPSSHSNAENADSTYASGDIAANACASSFGSQTGKPSKKWEKGRDGHPGERISDLEPSQNSPGEAQDSGVRRRNLEIPMLVMGLVVIILVKGSWACWAGDGFWAGLLVLPWAMLAGGGLLWCAIRSARWREEIFAWSPLVPEALARAAGLRETETTSVEHDSGGSAPMEGDYDPVGSIFRPGTEPFRAFCPPVTLMTVPSDGAVVFLTGVTGLVGKMVLFDLLKQGAAVSTRGGGDFATENSGDDSLGGDSERVARHGLKRVMVLVRAKKGVSASQRLASIRDSPMFRSLRESGAWADEFDEDVLHPPLDPRRTASARRGAFVTAVEGELGQEGLGLAPEARAMLAEAGVTHSLHCAASVSFSDPMAKAAATNVTGTLRVAALVASWPSCRVLIHVSTAFIHGGNSGTETRPLSQELPDLGGRNAERLYRSAQIAPGRSSGPGGNGGWGLGKEAVSAMAELGYPNTYTFTKALGEHLLVRALNAHNRNTGRGGWNEGETQMRERCGESWPHLRLRIMRPSIVGPAWVFPWPGWTGEQPSTVTGSLLLILHRVVRTFRLGPHPAPLIPVDVVSRAIVHSALGWGGPLTAPVVRQGLPNDQRRGASVVDSLSFEGHVEFSEASPGASCMSDLGESKGVASATGSDAFGGCSGIVADSRTALRAEALSGSSQGLPHSSSGSGNTEIVSIRNVAWATHVRQFSPGCDSPVVKGLVSAVRAGGHDPPLGAYKCGHSSGGGEGADGVLEEGRMPSFQEFSAHLYDFAVLRGLRPSLEALAVRASFSLAARAPVNRMYGSGLDGVRRRASPRSWIFCISHLLVDRIPLWFLRGIAMFACRLRFWRRRNHPWRRPGDPRPSALSKAFGGIGNYDYGSNVVASMERLDRLAALPSVYEPFTWRQYFFDSALRVPISLTPGGYALETALTTELLLQNLPGGYDKTLDSKASPERRRAILQELALQIKAHQTGGLRCGADSECFRAHSDEKCPGEGAKTARFSFLCRQSDALVPWPAVAWWAATLPGSAARGGITIWVRFVAFAVRTILCRAVSAVAVDVDSFRKAAPPGHGVASNNGASFTSGMSRRGQEQEIKEDGMVVDGLVDGSAERGDGVVSKVARGGVAGGGKVVVVLLPTHRSYLDFVLVSLLCASLRSLPGLSWLRMPKVAAADGPFGKRGALLRWIMEKLGAFFVRRSKKEAHSDLQERLAQLQEDGHHLAQGTNFPKISRERSPDVLRVAEKSPAGECISVGTGSAGATRQGFVEMIGGERWTAFFGADPRPRGLETFEVFVEGTRSRDRRFLPPKTGMLRALQAACDGATLWLVPVSISYERVPEQARLAEELSSAGRNLESFKAGVLGLIRWSMKALSGRVRLGKVVMRAGEPVALAPDGDVRTAVLEVQKRQRSGTVITPYHLRLASDGLGLLEDDIRNCVRELGGTVWDDATHEADEMLFPSLYYYRSDVQESMLRNTTADPPGDNDTETWMVHLQWMHLLEDEIRRSRLSQWADWLVPPLAPSTSSALPEEVRSSTTRDELIDKNPLGGRSSTAGDAITKIKASQGLMPPSPPPSWLMKASSPPSEDSAASSGEKVSELDKEAGMSEKGAGAVGRVVEAVLREFERAEQDVEGARQALVNRGFCRPSPGHVLQMLRNARESSESGRSSAVPSLFLATVVLALRRDDTESAMIATRVASTLTSTSCEAGSKQDLMAENLGEEDVWFGASDGDKEALGAWGFRDSGFSIASDRADGGNPYVVMRGNRYAICGIPLRGLLPFVREAVGVPITTEGRAKRAVTPALPPLPPSRLMMPAALTGEAVGADTTGRASGCTLLESMEQALGSSFDPKEQVSLSKQERVRHGTGHGLADMWSLRTGSLKRAPDAVVWPTSEEQVSSLMAWAARESVCLVPFGGGTSVTRALELPSLNVEPRPVVSVDMRKMCRVLSVDLENGTAHVEAGAVGRHLSEELASLGVTMGHEPDSLEFSTLGGWVATRASGMKRGRYGNIEDMVLEVRVVTGQGVAWQHSNRSPGRDSQQGKGHVNLAAPFSRTSVGLDLVSAILGSEGCLGIITSVVVKVIPLPQVSQHASYIFKDFQTGVAFCRELSLLSGRMGLASCRLLDNRQLRLGRAMKGEEDSASDGIVGVTKGLVSSAKMGYIQLMKRWDTKEMCAATLLFEGSRAEAALQRSQVSRIARYHGGIPGGADAGRSGYDLTFAIAYLRDFALLFEILGESFETFVSWTALEGLCQRVRERVCKEHSKRDLRGNAFVTHRVTQLYPEGACVYFYLAIYAEGVENPVEVFAELEEAARDEILSAGGSLSHHHGIGKARSGFMSRVASPVLTDVVVAMKRAFDPHNVLGARNHVLADGQKAP